MSDSRLLHLLDRLVNETITSGEHRELQDLLRNNSEAQETYFEFVDLHAGLHEWSVSSSLADTVEPGDEDRASDFDPRMPKRWPTTARIAVTVASLAAAVLCVVSLSMFMRRSGNDETTLPSAASNSAMRRRAGRKFGGQPAVGFRGSV